MERFRFMGPAGPRPSGVPHSRPLARSGTEAGSSGELPAWLSRLLLRFPRLRRYPHPLAAHFPIVFLWSATFFTLFYLFTGNQAFENTAFHCLGGGVLTTPVAVLSGMATHWLNFPGENGSLIWEKRFSLVLLILALTAFVWRLKDPEVLTDLKGVSLLYLALVLALTPLVTIISYFGGMLTYPLEADPPETGAS
jgi:uncharacterized membrane protein